MEKKTKMYLGLAGVLLAVSVLWNLYNKNEDNKIITEKTAQVEQLDSSKAELQKLYDSTSAKLDNAILQVDNLKTTNLKSVQEIIVLKKKINNLIHKGKITKKELVTTKNLLASMTKKIDFYIAENEFLKKQNEHLSEENRNLTVQKNQLEKVLSEAKEENNKLQNTVDLGSTLTVSDVVATSLKDNGKKTNLAKKVGKLRIT